jgi:hypothetical protein
MLAGELCGGVCQQFTGLQVGIEIWPDLRPQVMLREPFFQLGLLEAMPASRFEW